MNSIMNLIYTVSVFVPNASNRIISVILGIGGFLFGISLFLKIISTVIVKKSALKKVKVASAIVLIFAISYLGVGFALFLTDGGIF